MMLVVDPAPMIVSCSPEQQQQQQQHLMDGYSTSSGQTVGVMLASGPPFYITASECLEHAQSVLITNWRANEQL